MLDRIKHEKFSFLEVFIQVSGLLVFSVLLMMFDLHWLTEVMLGEVLLLRDVGSK